MALEADLLLNTRRFQAGIQDAERELRDFTDILDLLGDESEDAGRKSERALDDLGDAAEGVEDSVRDLTRQLDKVGDAGDDAGDKARRGFDRASEGVGELRDEANSTAREAAASFDGSADSIVDAFQEVAANAFAGFGPAGAAAGLLAAGGIGLATAAFGAIDEANQRSRERSAEWADAFIEAGGRVLGASQRIAMLQEIVTDPEQWQEAQDNAREWGVSVSTALRAMVGDTDALAEAERNLAEREREAHEGLLNMADGGEVLSEVLQGATADTRNGRDALDELRGTLSNGRDAADAFNEAMIQTARDAEGATESVDEFGNTVIQLPDGETVTINAETGVATTRVENVASQVRNLPDGHVNVTASTWNADRVLGDWAGRVLTKRVQVHLFTRAGLSIPV